MSIESMTPQGSVVRSEDASMEVELRALKHQLNVEREFWLERLTQAKSDFAKADDQVRIRDRMLTSLDSLLEKVR